MRPSKTLIAGAVTAAALAVGGGIAAANLGSDADEQAILNDAAARLGVEPSELEAALDEAVAARIDAAVAEGELPQERADRMKERLEEGGLPFFGGADGPHMHRHMHVVGGLDAAAAYLGLTEAELREALHDDRTLAELATAQGKTVDGLKEALVADATEHLNAAVAAGRLTEEQKQRILEDLPERIDSLVRGELPGPPPGLEHDEPDNESM
jgi:uncharacterized protein YidB (DUF937 family)